MEDVAVELAVPALHRCVARHASLRSRRPVEAEELTNDVKIGRRADVRLRRILYSLTTLAAFAMAIGAGWRPLR